MTGAPLLDHLEDLPLGIIRNAAMLSTSNFRYPQRDTPNLLHADGANSLCCRCSLLAFSQVVVEGRRSYLMMEFDISSSMVTSGPRYEPAKYFLVYSVERHCSVEIICSRILYQRDIDVFTISLPFSERNLISHWQNYLGMLFILHLTSIRVQVTQRINNARL